MIIRSLFLALMIVLFAFAFKFVPCDVGAGLEMCTFDLYEPETLWLGLTTQIWWVLGGVYLVIFVVINFLLHLVTPTKIKNA